MTVTYHQQKPVPEPLSEQLKRGGAEARKLRQEALDIADDVRALGKDEVALLRAELSEAVSYTIRSVAFGAGTVVAGILAGVFVCLSVMFVLYTLMPLWGAALLTTILLVAFATLCASLAIRTFKRISLVPTRTLNSLREDITWVRSQMTFSKS